MKKATPIVSLLFAIAGTVLGQQDAQVALPSVDLPPELARVLRDYERAWQDRDAGALARLFAEDGFVLPNGRLPISGRQAIEKY